MKDAWKDKPKVKELWKEKMLSIRATYRFTKGDTLREGD